MFLATFSPDFDCDVYLASYRHIPAGISMVWNRDIAKAREFSTSQIAVLKAAYHWADADQWFIVEEK